MTFPPVPAGYCDRMPPHAEAVDLVVAGMDVRNREILLSPDAAQRWAGMEREARAGGVILLLLSGYRSHAYQAKIIERKVRAGQSWEDILRVSAYPGHSEHHTGRAIDVGTPECPPLTELFAETQAFRWMQAHAFRYQFYLSYPVGNNAGVIYEPWHWYLREERPQT
ncbi:MAG TPA: D-alanyl-D-alanine carboxypeptidase family protein [Opitutaceae bacterium]|nr:D-alanyl-D-alanine carboxypeptidase family protein [Opitutaceae bacterium]